MKFFIFMLLFVLMSFTMACNPSCLFVCEYNPSKTTTTTTNGFRSLFKFLTYPNQNYPKLKKKRQNNSHCENNNDLIDFYFIQHSFKSLVFHFMNEVFVKIS